MQSAGGSDLDETVIPLKQCNCPGLPQTLRFQQIAAGGDSLDRFWQDQPSGPSGTGRDRLGNIALAPRMIQYDAARAQVGPGTAGSCDLIRDITIVF